MTEQRTADGVRPPYPETPRDDVVDELHGHRVADPYRHSGVAPCVTAQRHQRDLR